MAERERGRWSVAGMKESGRASLDTLPFAKARRVGYRVVAAWAKNGRQQVLRCAQDDNNLVHQGST